MKPSDPDFPFELNALQCTLTLPSTYPQHGLPTLRVTNSEIPRGHQINVEKGFDVLAAEHQGKPLLKLFNEFDRHLEEFLKAEKAQTVKLISNADKRREPLAPVIPTRQVPKPEPEPVNLAPPLPSWTSQQRSEAQAKRQADIRQLEARMGRLPGFTKSSDGLSFTVPVQIRHSGKLPVTLSLLREVQLYVPKLYNLEPCTIDLKGVYGSDADRVQLAFERHVRTNPAMAIMGHINFLAQNIHVWASETQQQHNEPNSDDTTQPPPQAQSGLASLASVQDESSEEDIDPDRPHVRIIPRPSEWDRHDSGSGSEYGSDDSDGYVDSDEDEMDASEIDGGANIPAVPSNSERGISLSFPNLELHGIELLMLATVSLSVRCLRCKSQLDISHIKPSRASSSTTPGPTSTTSTRSETCPKCATPFTLSYQPLPVHAHSVRAATLDLTGCTVVDFLPSTFQPTCSNCSTTFPAPPGMICVRGDTLTQICRSCHSKMTLTLPEVKFLRLAPGITSDLPTRKLKRENLGVTSGTPLALNGTCSHYSHSYRWFRFSCCGRVYPCDRCHDAAEPHVNDRAERMLCGWCSREQRFRPEDCGFCGRSVVRKRRTAGTGGFWEGGKGTRDKSLMSRKEKRKYTNKKPATETKS